MTIGMTHVPITNFEEFISRFASRFEDLIGQDAPDCPMCNKTNEWLSPGYTETPLSRWTSQQPGVLLTIPVICSACGYVAHFATAHFK